MFSHGLLFSGEMFAKQIEHFKGRYRCIAFDHRGQGQSPVTDDGYDIDTLTNDAIKLIEDLSVGPCHFVGLSMGGFVATRIALWRPDLLRSIILIESSAEPEPEENIPRYKMLNFIGRWFGLRVVINKVMPIMFGASFMSDPSRAAERKKWAHFISNNDRIGISRTVKGVIDRGGVYDQIDQIDKPTLIIVGDEDTATVPAKSERMHQKIAGSELVIIPRAGHSSTIEEPEAVNTAIDAFLAEI